MHSPAERYIHTCTRGLPPKSRRLVALELRGHIQERTHELMSEGLSETEAQQFALQELGAPAEVGSGLRHVYWNHTLIRMVMLAALVIGLSPGLLRSNLPALAITNEAFIHQEQARDLLSDLGISAPVDLPDPPESMTSFTQGNQMARNPSLRWDDEPFVNISYLLLALKQAGVVRVSGWTNPVLTVENTEVALGTPQRPVTAYPIYLNEVQGIIGRLYSGPRLTFASPSVKENRSPYFLSFPRGTGKVFALISARRTEGGGVEFSIDVQPASRDGTLNFELGYAYSSIQLYPSWDRFERATRHAAHAASSHRALPALLVSMDNRLRGEFAVLRKYGIFTSN